MQEKIEKARFLCEKALEKCKTPYGIIAGTHHFTDLWARDSLFATLGTNAEGDFATTKTTISTFLSHQKSDGLIPYLVRRGPVTIGKYFGKPRFWKKPRPSFRSIQSLGLVLDGGLMTIIATYAYLLKSGDKKFVMSNYKQLRQAIEWYVKRGKGRLLSEWFLCEWADSVLKIGKTLYINVLFWKALRDFGNITSILGKRNEAVKWNKLAKKIRVDLSKQFWNNRYFVDWIDYKRQDYFNTSANLLAIFFGLTDEKQTISILKFAKDNCGNEWTFETNFPKYPFWRVPFWMYLYGMSDYHNRGCIWLQPGILFALGLGKVGWKKEASKYLEKISSLILKHNAVYEIYEKNGSIVRRLFYQSEQPFAWSAGLFIYAYNTIFQAEVITKKMDYP